MGYWRSNRVVRAIILMCNASYRCADMSEPSKISYMTAEEYLKFEEVSKARHEYVHGQIFAMCGATEAHEIICGNLHTLINVHLRNSSCRAFVGNMKLRVEAADSFYYPDIMVTCEPLAAKSVFKTSPILVVEVLSPSTKPIDQREKLVAYKRLDSLKEYVIVHQNKMLIEVHRRCPDGEWELCKLARSGDLHLKCLPGNPFIVSITEVYNKLEFPHVVGEEEVEYEYTV